MKIVEFWLDTPILRRSLEGAPDIQVEWVQSDIQEGRDRIQDLLWASGGDFDAFEAAMEDDPTVTAPNRTIDLGDRRLYQVELVDEGVEVSIYPLVVEEGGVIQDLRGTHEGWYFRVGFPDESGVTRFFDFCNEHDIPFEIERILEERSPGSESSAGLTDAQRETIMAALDIGYFDVPRGGDLQDIGERLGISDNAASQRLRRGMKRLIEHSITRDVVEPP